MQLTILYSTLAIVFVGFILVHPMFGDGFLLFVDGAIRTAESYYLVEELLPKGQFFGWAAPLGNAGTPVFTYDYPFGFIVIAFLHYALRIDVLLAYKLVNFFAYVFPSLALFYFLKSRINYKIALVFSLLALFQYDFIWFPIGGMWNQPLSIGFLILFIHIFDIAITRPLNLRNFLLMGLLGGLILISHPFTSLFTVIFSSMALLIYSARRKIRLFELSKYLVASLVVALAISFFYLYPLLLTAKEIKPSAVGLADATFPSLVKSFSYLLLPHMRIPEIKETFGWSSSLIDLSKISNNITGLINASLLNFAEILLGVSIVAGIILYLKRRIEGNLPFVLALVLLANLFIASGLIVLTPLKDLPLLNSVHSPRFFIYERVLLIILAAYGINYIVKNNEFIKKYQRTINKEFVPLAILTFSILYLSFYPIISRGMIPIETSDKIAAFDDVEKVWSWVTDNVDGNKTRVYYQDTYFTSKNKQLNQTRVFSLSYKFTKVPFIGGWATNPSFHIAELYTNHRQMFGSSVDEINDGQIATNMSYYNSKYIVSVESVLEGKLKKSNLFKQETKFGELSIFTLKDYDPKWVRLNGNDIDVEMLKFEHENIEFDFTTDKIDKQLIVKMAYHPFWRAYVNGKPERIERVTTDFKGFPTNGLIGIKTNELGKLNVKLVYLRPLPF